MKSGFTFLCKRSSSGASRSCLMASDSLRLRADFLRFVSTFKNYIHSPTAHCDLHIYTYDATAAQVTAKNKRGLTGWEDNLRHQQDGCWGKVQVSPESSEALLFRNNRLLHGTELKS